MSRQKVSSMSVSELKRNAEDYKTSTGSLARMRLAALADGHRKPKRGHVRRLNW